MGIKDSPLIRAFLPPAKVEQRMAIPYTGGFGNTTVYGESRSSLGFGPDESLNAYQASEVAYRCVDFWASELSARPLVLEEADGSIEDTDPICVRFNKSSNDAESAVTRLRIMWAQLEQRGESFIYMDRGRTGEGEPTDFIVLMDEVQPLIADTFFDEQNNPRPRTVREMIAPTLAGFRVKTQHGDVLLLPSEVLWIRYPGFEKPWQVVAPATFARIPAMLDHEARKWQASELKNNARPSGIANLGSGASEEYAARYKAQLDAQVSGSANAGRIAVVGGGEGDKAGFSRMSLTPEEMSYIASHDMNGRDIVLAYGLSVDVIFGSATFNNVEEGKERIWSTGAAKLRVVSSEIDRQLFPDDTRTAIFDVRDVAALQENTDAIHERANKGWLADGMTLAEYRAATARDPLPDGDPRADMLFTQLQAYLKALDPATGTIKEPEPVPLQKPDLKVVEDEEEEDSEARISVDFDEIDKQLAQGLERIAPMQTEAQKAIRVNRVLRAYDRHERSLMAALKQHAITQERAVLRAVKKEQGKRSKATEKRAEEPIDPENVFSLRYWIEELVKALTAPLEALYVDAALATAEALDFEPTDSFMDRVTEAMRSRLEVLAPDVTATTYAAIRDEILRPGVEEGESIPKLTKRLTDVFDSYKGDDNPWRATRVARSETLGGVNQASYLSAEESGIVAGHIWRSTPDDRTRHTHAVGEDKGGVEGQYRPLGERFGNGLLFPGDPSAGKPRESIQCRCYLESVLIDEFND